LNRQLNGQSGSNQVSAWVSMDAISKALPKKGVLIDILRFSPAVYGAKSKEVQFRPPLCRLADSAGGAPETCSRRPRRWGAIEAAVQDYQAAIKHVKVGQNQESIDEVWRS